jgi:hypothetical protein
MSGMDGAKASARRGAAGKIVHTCVCGRVLHGNGHVLHERHCEQHLREAGWPLDRSMKDAIRQDVYPTPGSGAIRFVERGLGAVHLQRAAAGTKTAMTWPELRAAVWDLVDQWKAQR